MTKDNKEQNLPKKIIEKIAGDDLGGELEVKASFESKSKESAGDQQLRRFKAYVLFIEGPHGRGPTRPVQSGHGGAHRTGFDTRPSLAGERRGHGRA